MRSVLNEWTLDVVRALCCFGSFGAAVEKEHIDELQLEDALLEKIRWGMLVCVGALALLAMLL